MPSLCLKCKKPSMLHCSRCSGPYCGAECQTAHWPAHKNHCKLLRILCGHGISPAITGDLAALLTDPAAEAYEGLKGRGLRACRTIAAGETVGYIVGPKTKMADIRIHEYCYLWETVVGDIAHKQILPDEVNASRINDQIPLKAFNALVSKGPQAFIEQYEIKSSADVINMEEMPCGSRSAWGAYRAHAKRPFAVGTPLETSYGPNYWLNMLASGTLPRTTFEAAWAANWNILRGCPKFQDTLVWKCLERPVSNKKEREMLLAHSMWGFSTFPIWLHFEGVTMVYAGVRGKTFFPVGQDDSSIKPNTHEYVIAPWANEERLLSKDPEKNQRVLACTGLVGVTLLSRSLVRRLGGGEKKTAMIALIEAKLKETLYKIPIKMPAQAIARLIVSTPDQVDVLIETWMRDLRTYINVG